MSDLTLGSEEVRRRESLLIGLPLGLLGGLIFVASVSMAGPTAPIAVAVLLCAVALALTRPLTSLLVAIALIPLSAFALPAGASVLSPFELMCVLTTGCWVARRLASRQPVFVPSPLLIPFALLILISTIALLIVPDPLVTARVPIMWTVFLLAYQMIVAEGNPTLVRNVAIVVSAIGALTGLIAITNVGGAAQLASFGSGAERATAATLGHPDRLGELLALAIPFQLALAGAGPKSLRPLALLCVIPTAWGLALTLSRAAFLALTLALIFLLVLWRPLRRVGIGAAILLLILALLGSNPFSSVIHPYSLIERLESILQADDNPRIVAYKRTPNIIRDHPLIGVGPDQYLVHAARYGIVSPQEGTVPNHAHNVPLNIAAEQGLLGLAAFLWWAIALARISARACARNIGRERTLALAIAAAFLVLLMTGMADYLWQSNINLALTLVLAGCAVVLARTAPQEVAAADQSSRLGTSSPRAQAASLHA